MSENTFNPQQAEHALNEDDGNSDVRAWQPLQFLHRNSTILVSPDTPLTFSIPSYVGEHNQVWMDFHSANSSRKILDGDWFQAVHWNTIQVNGLEEGKAKFDGVWRRGDEWAPWTSQHVEVRKPAAFDANGVVGVAGTVSGTARPGSVIKLVRPADKAVMSTTHATQYNGRWNVTLSTGLPQGVHELQIREDVDGRVGRYTQTKTFTVLGKIKITSPDISLPVESVRPVIKGNGALKGASISIYSSDLLVPVVLYAPVDSNGEWVFTSSHVFERGARYTIIARQSLNGGHSDWGDPQEFYLIGPPVFTAPKPNPASPPIVEMKSMFEGTGATGFNQNRVDVYSEQMGDDAVAVGWPHPDTGEWRRECILTPGPHSIFGTQTVKEITSITSEPFGIRVRPGKPTVEYTLNQETMTFFSSGHYDQYLETQIQFTIKSYPGNLPPNTPPNAIVRADGTWTTTSTGWTLGTFSVEVVQKIVDNAGGWIESQPFELEIHNAMPDVTEVTHTKAYRPVFSGKGYNGATVSFYHPGGDLKAAPDVQPTQVVPRSTQTATYTVTLRDPAGEPLSGIGVHFRASLGDIEETGDTDHNGQFMATYTPGDKMGEDTPVFWLDLFEPENAPTIELIPDEDTLDFVTMLKSPVPSGPVPSGQEVELYATLMDKFGNLGVGELVDWFVESGQGETTRVDFRGRHGRTNQEGLTRVYVSSATGGTFRLSVLCHASEQKGHFDAITFEGS